MEGISIVEHEQLGRVLQATKTFCVGEVIVTEKPFLKFEDAAEAMKAVYNMDPGTQQAFFEFNHLAALTDASTAPECREYYSDMWKDTQRTVSLMDGVTGAAEIQRREIEVFRIFSTCSLNCREVAPSGYGIFSIGSHATHSCVPNSIHSSLQKAGSGCLVCIKPIAKGELITVDFGDHSLCTHERRAKLLREKNFFCTCEKCRDPDFARGLVCPACGPSAGPNCIKYCTRGDEGAKDSWMCVGCGDTSAPDTTEEIQLGRWIRAFRPTVRTVKPEHIAALEGKISLALESLARTHYIVTDMYSFLCQLHISVAETAENSRDSALKIAEARVASIAAGLDYIQLLECVESGCHTGIGCGAQHPPCTKGAQQMLWGCMDASKIPFNPIQHKCVEGFLKYKTLLGAIHSPDDAPLAKVQTWVDFITARNKTCLSKCGLPDCTEHNCGYFFLLECARCKKIGYCSKSAQKKHWKVHKQTCK